MHEGLGRRLVRCVVASAFVCLIAVAQKGPVRISGRVTDQTGAAVPRECVTLTAPGSQSLVAAVRTNGNGEFAFTGIAPNTYDLRFTFEPYPPGSSWGYKPQSLSVKTDGGDVTIPPVILEVNSIGPDYAYDENGLPIVEKYDYVQSYGMFEVHAQCGIDLDAGEAHCPGTSSGKSASNSRADDLRIEADGQTLYIAPINGAGLAIGDAHVRKRERCRSPDYSRRRIRVDELSEETPLCMRTNKRREAGLSVMFSQKCVPGDLFIAYVIYKQ